jgi:hypothetical protein
MTGRIGPIPFEKGFSQQSAITNYYITTTVPSFQISFIFTPLPLAFDGLAAAPSNAATSSWIHTGSLACAPSSPTSQRAVAARRCISEWAHRSGWWCARRCDRGGRSHCCNSQRRGRARTRIQGSPRRAYHVRCHKVCGARVTREQSLIRYANDGRAASGVPDRWIQSHHANAPRSRTIDTRVHTLT